MCHNYAFNHCKKSNRQHFGAGFVAGMGLIMIVVAVYGAVL